MIKRVIKKGNLSDDSAKADLEFWLSRTPSERVEAVDILRKQLHGDSARLQRVVRVIEGP